MSQLQRDFEMYYVGSYIGVVNEGTGKVNPFYIESVTYDDALGDGSVSNPEAVNGLVFSGLEITNENGRTRRRTVVGLENEQLVTDLPELGYLKIAGHYKWVTYRPNRTVKKGIVNRRITLHYLDGVVMWAIFNQEDNGRISKDYVKRELGDGVFLEYKNQIVGKFNSDTEIEIEPEMEFQISRIREENEGCQVTVKQAQESQP